MNQYDPVAMTLADLCELYGRPIAQWVANPDGTDTPVFVPPLNPTEQEAFDGLQALARATLDLNPDDWAAIDAKLPNLRTFRQQTRNQFMALTQTERDRAIFDSLQDIIAVLVAMLRDNG